MNVTVTDSLIPELARVVVAELAADELLTFDETSAAYLAKPSRFRRRQRGWGPMRFGSGAEVELLTPATLEMAKAVVPWLLHTITENLAKTGAEVLVSASAGAILRRWFGLGGRPFGAAEPTGFVWTPEQLVQIRELCTQAARRGGAPESSAAQMAEVVLARLQGPWR